jgi:hypothetical protein
MNRTEENYYLGETDPNVYKQPERVDPIQAVWDHFKLVGQRVIDAETRIAALETELKALKEKK